MVSRGRGGAWCLGPRLPVEFDLQQEETVRATTWASLRDSGSVWLASISRRERISRQRGGEMMETSGSRWPPSVGVAARPSPSAADQFDAGPAGHDAVAVVV